MSNSLSVLVPCGNSVDVIEECLKSVSWADELVVVDSFSLDGTLEIAKRYATFVLQHEYIDSATQKNWAIPQVSNEWVLIVDSDERVTEELRQEIQQVLTNPSIYAGFKIPRLNYAWNVPLEHGGNYPDYQLRLFQKQKGRYQGRRVHAHVMLDGGCGVLESPLLHFGQRSISQLTHHLLGDFTTWEAEERLQQNKHFHILDLTLRPPIAFLYRYLYLCGFLDGIPGFLMSCFWAVYVFLTYAKMWEMKKLQMRSAIRLDAKKSI